MIYLDNGATTFPKPECVYRAMDAFARTGAVNAGRGAYASARAAGDMIRETRELLISLLDAREQAKVIFTPSVTVALNEIILGFSWKKGDVAYVSPYEHNSVLRPLERMRREKEIEVIELPLKADLSIDLEQTSLLFREKKPAFVAVTAVSNVTGYILPAREIFTLAKQYKAFTLLDGAQAVGLLKLRFGMLRADAVSFAGHKTLYGPFGIGGFFLKNGVDLNITLSGGTGSRSESLDMPRTMPDKMECGSKDIVAIRGLKEALQWLPGVKPFQTEQHVMDHLLMRLREVPGIHLYAAPAPEQQAGVVSFNVDGFSCAEVGAILDSRFDIAVRAGHHCAARIHAHLKDSPYQGTVRASLGIFNTTEDADALADALLSMDRSMLEGVSEDILRGIC